MHKFNSQYPNGKIPRNSKGYGKTFICRRGCNTRTATYTEEFIWEDVYPGVDGDIEQLIDRVEQDTKTARRKPIENQPEEDGHDFSTVDGLEDPLETPRKRRKLSMALTPTKQRTPSKLLTPSHKRCAMNVISSLIC